MSPSARKVWIEIPMLPATAAGLPGHLPRGRCGLKSDKEPTEIHTAGRSPSARKVWIEIDNEILGELPALVTFREEGVD